MAAIYVRMILSGRMRLEDVPVLWREQVSKALEERTEAQEGKA